MELGKKEQWGCYRGLGVEKMWRCEDEGETMTGRRSGGKEGGDVTKK